MRSLRLAHYRWPKRHDFLIEQCRGLHVSEVLARVPDVYCERMQPVVVEDERGAFLLVPRKGGPFVRWWLVCPECRARRECLYLRPDTPPGDWRCRLCHGLIYASQRYGYRHELRKNPRNWPHRKRRIAQKRAEREIRARGVQLKRQARESKSRDLAADAALDAFIVQGREQILRDVRWRSHEQRLREIAASNAPAYQRCLDTLREIATDSPNERIRRRAAEALERAGVDVVNTLSRAVPGSLASQGRVVLKFTPQALVRFETVLRNARTHDGENAIEC